jgi:phage gp29-like protein
MQFYDSRGAVVEDGGRLLRVHTQDLPQEYLDRSKRERDDFRWRLDGLTKVATVPVAIVDRWYHEGFDINQATAKEIVARLKSEGLDLFVTAGSRRL